MLDLGHWNRRSPASPLKGLSWEYLKFLLLSNEVQCQNQHLYLFSGGPIPTLALMRLCWQNRDLYYDHASDKLKSDSKGHSGLFQVYSPALQVGSRLFCLSKFRLARAHCFQLSQELQPYLSMEIPTGALHFVIIIFGLKRRDTTYFPRTRATFCRSYYFAHESNHWQDLDLSQFYEKNLCLKL